MRSSNSGKSTSHSCHPSGNSVLRKLFTALACTLLRLLTAASRASCSLLRSVSLRRLRLCRTRSCGCGSPLWRRRAPPRLIGGTSLLLLLAFCLTPKLRVRVLELLTPASRPAFFQTLDFFGLAATIKARAMMPWPTVFDESRANMTTSITWAIDMWSSRPVSRPPAARIVGCEHKKWKQDRRVHRCRSWP